MKDCSCPPSITTTGHNLVWTHPCDGSPTTHYVVTMLPVSTSRSFVMKKPSHKTFSPSTTSTTFEDLDVENSNYVFVVTAVSGNVSVSSQPKQFKKCTCATMKPLYHLMCAVCLEIDVVYCSYI